MSVSPSQSWPEYRDDRIAFLYSPSWRVKAMRWRNRLAYAVESSRRATMSVMSLEIEPIRESLRAQFDRLSDSIDDHLTRRVARRGPVRFRHSQGHEALLIVTRNSDGRVMNVSWQFFLTFGTEEVYVNVTAAGAVDESEWLRCLDSMEVPTPSSGLARSK